MTPSNNGLDLDRLPGIAAEVGLDQDAFVECLNSDRHTDRVSEQARKAVEHGGRGTPYSVGVVRGGNNFVINGAQSFQTVAQMIEQALDRL